MKKLFRGRTPKIHFVGVGGIGMSGIAEILLSLGYRVSGSDIHASEVTERLVHRGATVFIGHAASHVADAELLVVSTAIRADNPERLAAVAEKIPIVHRGEMLAELMRMATGIAIAGSHGKTTTTSLVAHVLSTAGLDPTAIVGGVVKNFGSNARTGGSTHGGSATAPSGGAHVGLGDYLVAEADESDGSFLQLFPTLAVVTNIDPEHLEHYPGGFPELLAAFRDFLNRLPFYGAAILCTDHPSVRALMPSIKKRTLTYGLNGGDYTVRDLELTDKGVSFVPVRRGESLPRVSFGMIGAHQAQNALAALAIADDLGIAYSDYQQALSTFAGVGRRFEAKGEAAGVMVYDDYGHHPAEVVATLLGAKRSFSDRRLVVVFQPHRYTRTRDLLGEFATAFASADVVFFTEVYAAGEDPIPGATGRSVYEAVCDTGHRDAHFVALKGELAKELHAKVRTGDLVLTLGAGDIYRTGQELLALLRRGHS